VVFAILADSSDDAQETGSGKTKDTQTSAIQTASADTQTPSTSTGRRRRNVSKHHKEYYKVIE
jgi:hypothetical protein